MKNISQRSAFVSGVAICGAMIWGAAEILALQWSQLRSGLRTQRRFRAF